MAVFLTDAWFEDVDRLARESGDLNLPPALETMVINVKVNEGNEVIEANFANGLLNQGLDPDATTAILLNREVLQTIITGFDMNEIMGAFMSGKIRVEGDMAQLMALQSARPTPEQKALFKRILSTTTMA